MADIIYNVNLVVESGDKSREMSFPSHGWVKEDGYVTFDVAENGMDFDIELPIKISNIAVFTKTDSAKEAAMREAQAKALEAQKALVEAEAAVANAENANG